jgi:hypothetical protein
MCEHEGFYTCIGRYDRGTGRLVYFMVCDECHETLRSVGEQPYEPHFVDRSLLGADLDGGISPQAA